MHETKQAMTTAHKIKPENILLALDIGTEFVKAVIAEKTNDDNLNIHHLKYVRWSYSGYSGGGFDL